MPSGAYERTRAKFLRQIGEAMQTSEKLASMSVGEGDRLLEFWMNQRQHLFDMSHYARSTGSHEAP